jgi:hypothetical protein
VRGKDRPLGHSVVRELQKVLTDGVHNLQKRRLSFVVSFCFPVVFIVVATSSFLFFSFNEKNIISNV